MRWWQGKVNMDTGNTERVIQPTRGFLLLYTPILSPEFSSDVTGGEPKGQAEVLGWDEEQDGWWIIRQSCPWAVQDPRELRRAPLPLSHSWLSIRAPSLTVVPFVVPVMIYTRSVSWHVHLPARQAPENSQERVFNTWPASPGIIFYMAENAHVGSLGLKHSLGELGQVNSWRGSSGRHCLLEEILTLFR